MSEYAQQVYREADGKQCPICTGYGITVLSGLAIVDRETGTARAEKFCAQCGAKWYDDYILSRYVVTERGWGFEHELGDNGNGIRSGDRGDANHRENGGIT